MPIAVAEEHEDLRRTVRRWLDVHCPPEVARAALEADPDELPAVWKELADQGWLGLHVPERYGGQGFGLVELSVALDELGWSGVPGPVLSTVLTSAVVALCGSGALREAVLPGLADGSAPAAVHLGAGALSAPVVPDGEPGSPHAPDGALSSLHAPDGALVVSGRLRPVLGAPTARYLLAPVAVAEDPVTEREAGAPAASVTELDLDDAAGTRWCVVDLAAVGSVGAPARGEAAPAEETVDSARGDSVPTAARGSAGQAAPPAEETVGSARGEAAPAGEAVGPGGQAGGSAAARGSAGEAAAPAEETVDSARGGEAAARNGPSVDVSAVQALDPTRPVGVVALTKVPVAAAWVLPPDAGRWVRQLAWALAAAESAGGARWCVETTAAYTVDRRQFGRPIGQFQAVKHKLADMLVVAEQAAAVAWDAAQAVDAVTVARGVGDAGLDAAAASTGDTAAAATTGTTPADRVAEDAAGAATTEDTTEDATEAAAEAAVSTAVAGTLALDGFAQCAKTCVQLHGGIGFTWEHDAHRYLKRAMATRLLLGEEGVARRRVARCALEGARRSLSADLPPEADAVRAELAPVVAEVAAAPEAERRRLLVEHGLFAPHWPRPWGRDASALEQLVIDEELEAAGVVRPNLGVGAWALPTLIAHGTEEQQERWVRPSLLGELTWCQLFSEPGAGSDLAALSTRAEKVEGGWLLTGQKVWTSLAHVADWGVCLARSDPSVPKHEGISYLVVDMRADGIDIRPLRELTGAAMFNEVFLDKVFVPDDCLVGRAGDGWRIGRTTLANERVSMASGSAFGVGVESVLRQLGRLGEEAPPSTTEHVGALLAEAHSLRLLGHRATLRSLSGMDPGPGASVRKLLGAEHEQRVQEAGLLLLGASGAELEGAGQRWGGGFLATRCLTIAGGTSEVQRNVIAERLLGQPRDPEPVP